MKRPALALSTFTLVTAALASTAALAPAQEAPGKPAARAREPEVEHLADLDARFTVDRPGAAWRLRRSTSPGSRAVLSLAGKEISVEVSVRPLEDPAVASAYASLTAESARKAFQAEVDADLKRDLEKPAGLACEVGQLFSVPVLECRYEGTLPGDPAPSQFLEVRFARDDRLYRLIGIADKKLARTEVDPRLREAFASFALLPPQSATEGGYTDLRKGFSVERSDPSWSLDSKPFDDREPVVLRSKAGIATVRVATREAGDSSAAALVETLLESRKGEPGFQQVDRASATRGSLATETYRCQLFEKGQTTLRELQGFAALVGQTLVHVEASCPVNESDALKAEVGRALERVRLVDPDAARNTLANAVRAQTELAAGFVSLHRKDGAAEALAAFDAVARDFPDFARVHFLRALAHAELKQWKPVHEDLERARVLDPRFDEDARVVPILTTEARAHEKDEAFAEAVHVWQALVRREPKADPKAGPRADPTRAALLNCFDAWWSQLKAGFPAAPKDAAPAIAAALAELEKSRWLDPAGNAKLAGFFVDAGEILFDRKNHARAKEYAEHAISIDATCERARTLKKRCP